MSHNIWKLPATARAHSLAGSNCHMTSKIAETMTSNREQFTVTRGMLTAVAPISFPEIRSP